MDNFPQYEKYELGKLLIIFLQRNINIDTIDTFSFYLHPVEAITYPHRG